MPQTQYNRGFLYQLPVSAKQTPNACAAEGFHWVLQACPLLTLLCAQHNKITAFPARLDCLLLRMLNLNGNRCAVILQ